MPDETKPDGAVDETTLDAAQDAKPEGRETAGEQPSEQPKEPSQGEAIERERYEAAVRAMNEAQRKAASLEDEAERLRAFANAQLQRERERENPESAAWDKFQQSWDPGALREFLDARDQRVAAEASRRALQDFQVETALVKAREYGIESREEMQRLARTLTPEDFGLIKKHRDGKLRDYLNERYSDQEKRAKRARALDVLQDGMGGGRAVPGTAGPGQKVVPFPEWAALSDEAKDRIRKSGDDVLVVGAPPGFNPETQ